MLQDCGAGEDSWDALGQWGDQTSLKEINPEYSLEGLMLKLKLQYFSHLMQSADSLENAYAGKDWRQRKGQQGMRLFDSITDPMDVSLSELQKPLEGRGAWRAAIHGVAESQTWLSNWTTTTKDPLVKLCVHLGWTLENQSADFRLKRGKRGWYHIHLDQEKKELNSPLCFCLSECSLFINNGKKISFHFKKDYTSFWQLITLKNM